MSSPWYSNSVSSICIIVPAHNEAATIQQVIADIRKISKNFHIVVVNDGSTDETGQKAADTGVVVLTLPFNTGIGGAVQTGMKYAVRNGYDIAIQVDGDGQHPPREIPKLLRQLTSSTDVVIGSRFVKKTRYKSTLSRRVGGWIFSELIHLVTGTKISDPTSGFRLYNNRALQFLSQQYPIDFPEPESVVYLLKNNYRIKEVEVKMKKRVAGHSSIAHFKALYLYLSILLGILISSFRKTI